MNADKVAFFLPDGMMTMMRCNVQGQQVAESGILRAIGTSRTVSRSGRVISFRSASGSDVLRIQRQ